MLTGVFRLEDGESFQFSPENVKGEKGRAGTTASNLGPGRKGSPCVMIQNIGWQRGLAETHNDTLRVQFAYLQPAAFLP